MTGHGNPTLHLIRGVSTLRFLGVPGKLNPNTSYVSRISIDTPHTWLKGIESKCFFLSSLKFQSAQISPQNFVC